jgi:AcrR family transcriptional regulator
MRQATRRHAPADVRRAEILEACRHLFAERRYVALSTTDIARASGVSWSLVAHYFGDKAGLYRAVLESIVESTREPDLDQDTLEERVTALVEHGLTTIEHSRCSWLAVIGGTEAEHPDGIQEIVERGRERSADLALAALGEATANLSEDHSRAVARAAVGLIETGAQEWLVRHRLTRDDAVAYLTASVIALADAAQQSLDRRAPFGNIAA